MPTGFFTAPDAPLALGVFATGPDGAGFLTADGVLLAAGVLPPVTGVFAAG